jgi:hypothetical protein
VVNELGEGNTTAGNAPSRDQHAHGGRSFEYRQRLSGSANLYGLEAHFLQHVDRDHTNEMVSLCNEDS